MKALIIFLVLSGLFQPLSTQAQKLNAAQERTIETLFKSKSVVHFKFNVQSVHEVKMLGSIISIDKGKGNTVFAHATKKQFRNFIVKNYKYTVVPSPRPIKKVRSGVQSSKS